MAINLWPNWLVVYVKNNDNSICPANAFNKSRTRAMRRIGPHNIDVLSIIICLLLGDLNANKIKGEQMDSVRFSLEQCVNNSAYIHHLNILLHELGYCSNVTPKLLVKSLCQERGSITRFNYRLTTLSFTNLLWIYEGFYVNKNKKIPAWIGLFITPAALAHLVMQIGSLKEEGLILYLKLRDQQGISLIKTTLKNRYNILSAVIYEHREDEVFTVLCIRVESIPLLRDLIHPYMHPSLYYILETKCKNYTETFLYNKTHYKYEQKPFVNRGNRIINKKSGHL